MSKKYQPQFLFVGERRSKLAESMGVTWESGRLAAKQLLDALNACGIEFKDCSFENWFDPYNHNYGNFREWVKELGNPTVVAMGKKVQNAMRKEGIDFIPIIHPAARGAIRKKERYTEHIRKSMEGLLG